MIANATQFGGRFAGYLQEIFRSRRMLVELTRREFRGRYLGSAFGLLWVFIHPAVMMLIYWLVFGFTGLGGGTINSIPYGPWLLTGLVPWFFMAEFIGAGSTVIMENRFFIKKIVFRASLLPIVRLMTLLPVHAFFLFSVSLIMGGYKIYPTIYSLQIFYYLFAGTCLGLGLSFLNSALVPFLRDYAQIISLVMQVFFWLTPIVWPAERVPEKYRWVLELNPLNYIVRGYRESMVQQIGFWRHPLAGCYFWGVTGIIMVVGGMVFLRLRSHFADVL